MLVHLITSLVVTAIVLLMVWAIYKTRSKRMPGGMYPLVAAISIIAYGIYTEYSWESRTLSQMPESIRVVHEISRPSVFSPWAYLIPRTSQLSLIDSAALRTNEKQPGLIMTDLLIMQRLYPTVRLPMMIDCQKNARADLQADQRFTEGGLPEGVEWVSLKPDHVLLKAACEPDTDPPLDVTQLTVSGA